MTGGRAVAMLEFNLTAVTYNVSSVNLNQAVLIIYNITTKVHSSIDTAWRQWQKEEFIPLTMQTGCFINAKLLHLLEQDDSEGKTYALQLTAETVDMYEVYVNEHAALARQNTLERWGNKIISFHSLLEVIH